MTDLKSLHRLLKQTNNLRMARRAILHTARPALLLLFIACPVAPYRPAEWQKKKVPEFERDVAETADLTVCQRYVTGREQSISHLKLNQLPMIQSHDAATGYHRRSLVGSACPESADGTQPDCPQSSSVMGWTKTQNFGFRNQLACGARALDLRITQWPDPGLMEWPLFFHHGPVLIEVDVEEAVVEVIDWAANRAAERAQQTDQNVCGEEEDLIVLKLVISATQANTAEKTFGNVFKLLVLSYDLSK